MGNRHCQLVPGWRQLQRDKAGWSGEEDEGEALEEAAGRCGKAGEAASL